MENICVCLTKCITYIYTHTHRHTQREREREREALSDIPWQYMEIGIVEAMVVGCGADAYAKEMVVERVPYYQ